MGSLTPYQKSVIIGSLLGDGYVRTMPGRRDSFLEINHAFHQRAYVDWKHDVLRSITASGPKTRKSNGGRIAYRFNTRQHPYLSFLRKQFYKSDKKVIPKDLTLDPVILAVWFMDDGSRCRAQDVYLNTQQFDLKDQNVLLDALREMQLFASLNKDKEYQRIRFFKSSIPRLHELVTPHIIPSMRYKLHGHDPVETTRRSPALLLQNNSS